MSQQNGGGSRTLQQAGEWLPAGLVPCVGRISGVSGTSGILVEWDHSGPKEARLLAGLSRTDLAKPQSHGREVLLAFDQGNPERPIIVGVLADPLEDLLALDPADQAAAQKEMVIDGERIIIEGKAEIVLKCGEGSITLRKDGKIIIKGTHLLSRASGPNRIKGGSVQIN